MKISHFIINARTPICPICNSRLRFSEHKFSYLCYYCVNEFKIIKEGQAEHEFIVELKHLEIPH